MGLIQQGRVRQAIDLALKEKPGDADLIQLSGRMGRLEEKIKAGTITNENALIEQNSISASLAGIVG